MVLLSYVPMFLFSSERDQQQSSHWNSSQPGVFRALEPIWLLTRSIRFTSFGISPIAKCQQTLFKTFCKISFQSILQTFLRKPQTFALFKRFSSRFSSSLMISRIFAYALKMLNYNGSPRKRADISRKIWLFGTRKCNKKWCDLHTEVTERLVGGRSQEGGVHRGEASSAASPAERHPRRRGGQPGPHCNFFSFSIHTHLLSFMGLCKAITVWSLKRKTRNADWL